jgi:hypothetical protein
LFRKEAREQPSEFRFSSNPMLSNGVKFRWTQPLDEIWASECLPAPHGLKLKSSFC